jgi:hypothetical protein
VPVPVVNPQPVDGGDDWPQSDVRAMKRDLLRLIHRYYLDAISRLPHAELNNKATLARALLVGGHCFGPLGPVHNIIVNSIWYAAAAATDGDGGEEERPGTVLSTDGIARVCHRSLQGLVASLRRHCPSLRSSSTGDALHHLMNADADLTAAVALASGTSASSAKQAMVSRNLAAFRLAAEAAGHPDPAAFARFASSALPAANARHDIFQFLLVNRALSAGDIRHLSTLLAPPAALPSEEPPRPPHPLALRPEVSPQKQQVSDTGRQVIRVVDMAAQHYTSQTGVQLALHSVCGVCLLKEQELLDNCCYHINFLAHRRDSTSALGFPVLLFTEAVALAHDDIDVKLCVIVDPATDIGM